MNEDYISQWIDWAFNKYSNGNARINKHQMKLAVICLTGKKPVLDKNQNSFTIQDLRDIVGHLKKESIFCDMNTIYDAIDKEGKGYVSIDDLKNAAKQYNATVNETALINAFKTADRDRDGRITYQDFINFVKSGMIDLGIV